MFSGKINMEIRYRICKHNVEAFERRLFILNLLVFALLVICLFVEKDMYVLYILRALILMTMMMMILQHSL